MIDRSLFDNWGSAVVLTVVVHGIGALIPYTPGDVDPPQELIEIELVAAPAPEPPPPPEPEPEPEPPPGPKNPDPEADPTKTSAESNRPEPETPEEPVPLRTGMDLEPDQLVEGGLDVRVGNTNDPGYDADVAPNELKGFSGGGAGGGTSSITSPERPAELVRRFQPRYPETMVDEGIEGPVMLNIEVLPNGRAGRVEVVNSVHPELDRVAVQAMQRFRWRAARHKGKRVTSTVRIVVMFRLDR